MNEPIIELHDNISRVVSFCSFVCLLIHKYTNPPPHMGACGRRLWWASRLSTLSACLCTVCHVLYVQYRIQWLPIPVSRWLCITWSLHHVICLCALLPHSRAAVQLASIWAPPARLFRLSPQPSRNRYLFMWYCSISTPYIPGHLRISWADWLVQLANVIHLSLGHHFLASVPQPCCGSMNRAVACTKPS